MSNQELYQENVRVLVAEDDYLVGTMIKGLLEETGYTVVGEAANGLEAVEMTQSLQPDVVLMDIKLPRMDGIEATRRIYESCPTPVVMLTAYDTLEMAEQASAAGAGAYLVKPPNVREMARVITVAIARFGDMMELRHLNAELRAEITERVRAEEALRKSEARYRTVVEYQTDLLSLFRPDGTLTFVNEAYCRYFGKQRDELIGSNIASLVPEEDREELTDYLASFSPEKQVGRIEHRNVAAGGKIRWVQWIDRPIFDERGDMIEYQSVGRDITERKQAEEALRKSEERFRQIYERMATGVSRVSLDFRIRQANQAYCKMLGYTEEELVGKHLKDITHPEVLDENLAKQEKLRQGEIDHYRMEKRFIHKRGHTVHGILDANLIRDVAGKPAYFLGSVVDITERKLAEQQLRQQERLAAVGQLAGGIAHDFNNLLTTIILYAQISLGKRDLPPDLGRAFETIFDESRKAAKLVQQILDFSRRATIEVRPLDLTSFTEKVIDMLRRTIPEHIRLLLEVGAEEYVVEADPTRIQQVLMNLATNARDAMPGGGELRFELSRMQLKPDEEPPVAGMPPPSSLPHPSTPLRTGAGGIEGGEWVCLAVSDTGAGMTEEVRAHLFEPFFTTKEMGKGTGLGLAQVYGIVRQHEGYIGVETEMGKGTTFRVYLPACGMEAMEQVEEASATPRGKGETILLVEDNENLRRGGQELLESLGYRVLTAANGREALRVHEAAERVDLVITDLVMPEMGGQQLVHELRQATPGLEALAITGYVMREYLEELKEEGFLDAVHKPFDIDVLARAVRRALDED